MAMVILQILVRGAGAQTEVIWGVNNGTAIGKKIFETVTGVTVDKAVAGAVKIGVSGGDLTINGALNNSGTAELNGKFVLEIGFDQKNIVINLLKKEGFYINSINKDLAKNDRCIVCSKI